MGLSLRNIGKKILDVAQGVERQVNPLDNNMTYKQKAPTSTLSVGQQLRNAGKAAVQFPVQFTNTVKAGAGGAYGLGRIYAAQATGNQNAYRNAINQTIAGFNKDLSPTGGIFHQGTFFDSPQQALNISGADLTKKIIGKGIEGSTYFTPGKFLPKFAENKAKSLAIRTGTSAVQNAAQAGGAVLASGGNIGDIAKATTIGAVTGAPGGLLPVKEKVSLKQLRGERPSVHLPNEIPTPKPEVGVKQMSNADLNERINTAVKDTKDSLKVSGAQKIKNKVGELYDPLHEAVKIDQADAKARGVKYRDLPAEQRLDFALDKTRYSSRQARQLLNDNGVSDIIKRYPGKNEAGFVNYLNARFALEVGEKRGIQMIPGETPESLSKYVADFEQAHPNAVNDAATVKAHSDNLLDRGVSSGLIPKEEADYVKSFYQNYVPISRVIPQDLARQNIEMRALGSVGKQRILQNIDAEPSRSAPLDNTFDALLKRTEMTVKQSNLADAQRLYAQKVDAGVAPGRPIVEGESTVGKQVVSGLNEGKKYQVETTPEIARMLQGLDETKKSALEKGLMAPMKVFQTAWTGAINPIFSAISFAFYDLPMSAINSTQGLKVFAPKAVGEMFRSFNRNSEFQQALSRAGAQITGGSQLPVEAKLTAQSIAAERNLASRFKFNATHPGEALRNLDVLGGKLSNATRSRVAYAHYNDAIKQGATFEQAMSEAAQAYNNVLPNYGRVAPLVKAMNAVIPYSGASIAGTRSLLRAIKDDPAATIAKITALVVTPAIGSTAYSLSNPSGQDFYNDMINSKRQYVLDNNYIIVLPGAHKDPKTGQWNGVIKVPLPPEMRAVNSTAWRATHDFLTSGQNQATPQQAGGALFDFMTGGLRTGGNPIMDTYRIGMNQDSRSGGQITNENMLNLDKKDQVTSSTTSAAKNLSKLTGYKLSPVQFDKVLQQFGFPGQLIQNREGNVAKTAIKSVKDRFEGAYGQSNGSKYFNSINNTAAEQKLAGKDMDVLKSLLDREVDLNGKPVKINDKDTLYKFSALTNNPRVAKVLSDAAKKRAADNGETLDPLYKLSDEQQNIYYRQQATPYKSDDYTQLADANPWLETFKSDRSKFFKDHPITPGASDKVPFPTFGAQTDKNLNAYFATGDAATKAKYLSNHPDVQNALDEMGQYTNTKREAQGYAAFKDYPKADSTTQKIIDYYNGLPTGDGKNGGNATRYTWIKSHPAEYQKMQNYFTATSAWQLANNAGSAKYVGSQLNQKALKAAYNLGQYDIVKNKDGTYSLGKTTANTSNSSFASGNYSKSAAYKNARYLSNTEKFRVSAPSGRVKKTNISLKKGVGVGKKFKVTKVSPRRSKVSLKKLKV